MASIAMLLALIFYVFAVMATKLFGEAFPDWFGTIGESAYSLFQIMTLESWSMGIVRPVMEGSPQAWLFFVPFIVITTFAVLNLFVGIIVDAMQSQAGTPLGTAEAVTAPPMPTASPPSLGTPKAPARWVQGNTSSKPERRASPEEASLARGQASPGTEVGDTPWRINLQSASALSPGSW